MCLALVFGQPASAQTKDAPKPNIIFILADDMGYADLGCYGQTHFETPHIDQLATEGMRFTQQYAGSTVCAPSRATLLGGKHTGHTWQRANGKTIAFRLNPQDITVATLLKQAGYTTGMIGKSGLSGNTNDLTHPHKKGFDHFFGFLSHRAAHRYYPPEMVKNGQVIQYSGNEGKEGVTYCGNEFLADALTFLEAHQDGPFFLHLALQQPHADLQVTKPWRDRYLGSFQEKPYKGGHYRAETHPKATYAGMIGYLDDTVGQVIAKLKALGIQNNTLLIFSSDNGTHNVGGHKPNDFGSSGPYRGHKRDLYEGGIRVPYIAWWPGTVPAGSVSDHVGAFWDFMPTACDLAGIQTPDWTDGISIAPTLTGRGEQAKHEHLYWEFHEQGGKQAVLMGDWKAVRLNCKKNPSGPVELYNLAVDPSEANNLADQHPGIVKQVADLMKRNHVVMNSRYKFGEKN